MKGGDEVRHPGCGLRMIMNMACHLGLPKTDGKFFAPFCITTWGSTIRVTGLS